MNRPNTPAPPPAEEMTVFTRSPDTVEHTTQAPQKMRFTASAAR